MAAQCQHCWRGPMLRAGSRRISQSWWLSVRVAGVSRTVLLTDAPWCRIEPLLPSSRGQRGRPFRDHRQVVEGMIYRLRAGIRWRDLPVSFGPWQTVWKRHRRFSADGTWDRTHTRLLTGADVVGDLVSGQRGGER